MTKHSDSLKEFHKCAKTKGKCTGLKGKAGEKAGIGYYACALKANCRVKPRKKLMAISTKIAGRKITKQVKLKSKSIKEDRIIARRNKLRKKLIAEDREKANRDIIKRRLALKKKLEKADIEAREYAIIRKRRILRLKLIKKKGKKK